MMWRLGKQAGFRAKETRLFDCGDRVALVADQDDGSCPTGSERDRLVSACRHKVYGEWEAGDRQADGVCGAPKLQ